MCRARRDAGRHPPGPLAAAARERTAAGPPARGDDVTTQRDGVDVNLTFIPRTFTLPPERPFDTASMEAPFQVGHGQALHGQPWGKVPPGWRAPTVEPPPSRRQVPERPPCPCHRRGLS